MSTSGQGTSIRLVVAGLMLSACFACGGGPSEPPADGSGQVLVGPAGDESYLTARDVWMSMADEPLYHMRRADRLLDEGDDAAAARALEKSASLFRWGRLYASGAKQTTAFVTTAQKLEAVARSIRHGLDPEPGVLDAIVSEACDVLAQQQLGLALDQWKAGEHVRVALLMRSVADELSTGVALSKEPAMGSIDGALTSALEVADRLETADPPTEAEVRGALKGLEGAATRLDRILSSRSRSGDATS